MEPKRVIGPPDLNYHGDLFIIRKVYYNNMQEFLDPAGDAKEMYEGHAAAQIERRKQAEESFNNRLKPDSNEQKHYDSVVESIVDYDNIEEWKHRRFNSFKKKIFNLFR